MDKNLRGYMAELLGTFALVFVTAGVVCANQLAEQRGISPRPELVGIALAQGLILAVGLAATMHLAGGYLNPAVTITLWACKRLDNGKTLALIGVQLLGAAIAGGLIRFLWGFDDTVLTNCTLGTPHLQDAVFRNLGGLREKKNLFLSSGIEAALTFILTFAIFATTIDPRAPRLLGKVGKWLAGLWIGLVQVALVMVAFPITGACTNPGRWFGTVIWENTVDALSTAAPFRDSPVYLIGPLAGGCLAGMAYSYLLLPPEQEHAAATSGATGKTTAGAGLAKAKK